MRLGGRRILVTGAASGIGRAIAHRFVQEGAQVALLDRVPIIDTAIAIQCDLLDQAAIAPAVTDAAARMGGLDGVVNCAGADLMQSLEDMSPAAWQRIIDVNLTAPMLVCRAALPAMKAAGRGTIIAVASGAALRPLPNRTAYCAAKAGVVMFCKSLSIELSASNIRVNAVCPGIIDTPMWRSSWEGAPDPEAELAMILDRYVIKRVGQPREIADAALFLTSDESSYMTGTAIAVDGGRTFH
ncbi:SDR family NAD(P)-dependent oxidoreductase [Elioraea sp.]|uniref:SDR family NAD(P)-dependent oxidoreductase n=1 Tax=Elioraea sp. TaxID=2185103 RepID=UPI0025BE4B39|nr:SDR family NAD(P)-dependent oxidoreductase [Elioraea sp.]